LQKLHVQTEIWRPNDKNVLCSSCYVVNDNTIVDGRKYQIMHFMFCHTNPIVFNPRKKERKIIISYYKK
jgi:hypothetical protein